MYFMDHLPQTLNYNPAFAPEVNYFVSMPVIGNIQAESYNSGFNIGQFMDFSDKLGNSNYNPDEFTNRIGDFNKTFLESRMNLFSTGFRLGQINFFSFSISERNFLEMTVPSNFVYLLDDLDKVSDKMPLNINGTDMRLNTFSQLAVTWTRQFGEKLTIGISPKFIFAMVGLTSDNLNLKVNKLVNGDYDEENYETKYSGNMLIGLPVAINPEAINDKGEFDPEKSPVSDDWFKDYSHGKIFSGNGSFAFDLGANYQLNEKISFAASLTDIGSTRWKKNGYLLQGADTTFKVIKDRKLNMTIPTKLYFSAKYQFSPRWNTGLMVRNMFSQLDHYTSATLSLNGYIGRMLSTSVSYTAGNTYDNLGLGIRLRFLPQMDFYVVTDNVLAAFNYKGIQNASVALGINMTVGLKKKDKVKDQENQEIQK